MQENKPLNITLTVIRVFVGALFIFSGLIKANDPSGLAYKMGEFYEVWAREGYLPGLMKWLNEYALASSIAMITFEIVAGVALIIGYRFKLFSYLILLLTIFFTFLTGYALYSGNIKECGCFGDCIKLQANESFMKDLILLALILILVFFRKRIKQSFNNVTATAIIVLTFLFCFIMQWYVLKHLPFKDCLAYRIGNNITKEMTPGPDYKEAVYETTLVYEKDGVKKNFTDKNFPWQDTTWKFVDSKSVEKEKAQNEPQVKDFFITSFTKEDYTQSVLGYKGNAFLVVIKDVDEAHTENIQALQTLIADCKKMNIPMLVVTSSNEEKSNAFKTKYKLDIDFANLDGTVCKTAMRTNPGIFLLNEGTIKGKWSYADYPTLSNLKLEANTNATPFLQSTMPTDTAPAEVDSTIN